MFDVEKIEPKYSLEEIKLFDNENRFMDAEVELLKQSISLVWIIIGIKYCDENENPIKLDKEDAVIAGNLTRLVKLNTSFLQNICEYKSEICFILNRCIAETYVNLKYLLLESEDRVRKNYIKYSLITEKKLWNTIKENISKRNGETLPIEERMQKSIEASFEVSDFNLEEVNNSSKWKSVSDRAETVASENFYNIFYGISSHSIHGNWQDILFNNLERTEDGFKVQLNWKHPRPQIIEAPIIFNLDIVNLFAEKELDSHPEKELIIKKCLLLNDYLEQLESLHEVWLKK